MKKQPSPRNPRTVDNSDVARVRRLMNTAINDPRQYVAKNAALAAVRIIVRRGLLDQLYGPPKEEDKSFNPPRFTPEQFQELLSGLDIEAEHRLRYPEATPPPPSPWKRIRSTYDGGTCRRCDRPIMTGEIIYWRREDGAIHDSCWSAE